MFHRAHQGSRWTAGGAWIYGAGSDSGIAVAALEPFLEMYAAAQIRLRPGRRVWAAVASVHPIAMLLALGAGAAGLAAACRRIPA